MFSHMQGTLTVALGLAAIVFLAALVAEGRGSYFLRLLLGLKPNHGRDHLDGVVPRDAHHWEILKPLERSETRERKPQRSSTPDSSAALDSSATRESEPHRIETREPKSDRIETREAKPHRLEAHQRPVDRSKTRKRELTRK